MCLILSKCLRVSYHVGIFPHIIRVCTSFSHLIVLSKSAAFFNLEITEAFLSKEQPYKIIYL